MSLSSATPGETNLFSIDFHVRAPAATAPKALTSAGMGALTELPQRVAGAPESGRAEAPGHHIAWHE